MMHNTIEELHEVGFDDIIGKNSRIIEILRLIVRIASKDISVIILGESGSGKELFARAIHRDSSRKNKPFISVNCAAIPEQLVESELFGYERGAFTGANMRKIGYFEQANEGTLFLDEIGNMSLHAQAKILKAIDEKQITKLGNTIPIQLDIRIISATNINLKEAVKQNEFREDLYFRLNEITINIPPLRERTEDIPIMCSSFLKEFQKELNTIPLEISDAAMSILTTYSWPGNVRELKNVIKRAAIMASSDIIWVEHLPIEFHFDKYTSKIKPSSPLRTLGEVEKEHIQRVMEYVKGNKKTAANILGVDRTTLYRKIKSYKIGDN